MDIFRLDAEVTRACFSDVNLDYEGLLCAYQTIAALDIDKKNPGKAGTRGGSLE